MGSIAKNAVSIAVIGRGFQGVASVAKLVEDYDKDNSPPLVITSIDHKPVEQLGGLAYSAPNPRYVLNVPDKSMSTSSNPKRANEFLDFQKKHNRHTGNFSPRADFQELLKKIWDDTVLLAKEKGIEIIPLVGEAVSATKNDAGLAITLKDGSTIESDLTVLALGHNDPKSIKVHSTLKDPDPRVIQTPLKNLGVTAADLQRLHAKGIVPTFVLEGFGNTGVDLAIALQTLSEEAHVKIKIIAAQRHNDGIVQHPTGVNPVAYSPDKFKNLDGEFPTTADGFWKNIQDALDRDSSFREGDVINMSGRNNPVIPKERKDYSPQEVIDAVRSVLNQVVGNFTEVEQEQWYQKYDPQYRFLRNRVPPEVGAKLKDWIKDGTLELHTAEITGVISNGPNKPLTITLAEEKNGEKQSSTLAGEGLFILNAKSPDKTLEANPLKASLLQKHVIQKTEKLEGLKFRDGSTFLHAGAPIISLGNNLKYPESIGVRELRGLVEKAMEGALEEILAISKNKLIGKFSCIAPAAVHL